MARQVSTKRRDVVRPRLLVEVDGEQPAAAVFEHRIDADHVAPLEMIEDRLVTHRDEGLVRTVPALDARLLAHARTHSFAQAGA